MVAFAHNIRSLLALSLALLVQIGCVQTLSDEVAINDTPEDDRSYLKAYEESTRDTTVVVNFETRYTLTATYLSPDFRAAFAKRFQKLFDAPQPFLEEASNKVGFFVSIYSPSREGYDLTSEQLWSIQLKSNDRSHKPVLIKKLDQKSRWTPFFTSVHEWSSEYLILFDVPSQSVGEKMVGKSLMNLHLANADAKTILNW